ncbi:MAG: hypothetical protein JRI43_06230 [Deltaproteobacteria bacterium]|nr:hypothetical protein [Deltaproteobacteria bacterium]MBW1912752.1 hypothetical protein [Deltaproteobacteria bacterium]
MESKIVYFEKPGGENTDEVLRIAAQRADELGIKTVVVASNSGSTGIKALDACKGQKVVTVTHCVGFKEENQVELTEENRKIIQEKGGIIHTATHAFGGISRAMRQASSGPGPGQTYVVGDIAAAALKCFGQGTKVCIEVAAMAADAGLARTDEEIIAVAGTGREGGGCDTALVLQPNNAHRLFDIKVKEILCKPRL